MKPSKLPVTRRTGAPAPVITQNEAYSDYDEFSSREGLVTVDGLQASYSEATATEEVSYPPLESPSQGASNISKRFSQKDVKTTFKRHLPRSSNPLAPDPHTLHPPTVHDYQARVAELESQNTFLKFKLRLQLNDADAAELEYHRAYQAIAEDNSNLHFMNELMATEEARIRREAEEALEICRVKEAKLNAALASNDAMIQEKEDQLQAFLEKSMELIKRSDEKQQQEYDERCQDMERKEQEYMRLIAELDAVGQEREEEHQQRELRLQQRIDELGTAMDNLKWGFKLRENELTREQEIHQTNAVELYGANQDLKQKLSDAATAAYELLANLEKLYQSPEDRDPMEAVNLTVGGVLHLISVLDTEPPEEKKNLDSEATSESIASGYKDTEGKPAAPSTTRRSLPGKLEVVEEVPEEEHSMLSVDITEDPIIHHVEASQLPDTSVVMDAEAELNELREKIREMEEERAAAEQVRAKEAAAVERLLNMVATLQQRHEEEEQIESQHEQTIQEQAVKIEDLLKQLGEAREALKQQDEDTFAGFNATIADLQEQVSTLEQERQAMLEMFKGVEEAYEGRITQLLKRIEMLEGERQLQDHEIAMTMLQSHQKGFSGPTLVSPRDDGATTVSAPTTASSGIVEARVAGDSPLLRSVDSTSPVPTPPNQVLIAANEDHESNMQLLLNNQSFLSNIAMDEEERSLLVDASDTSFEVSRIGPSASAIREPSVAVAAAAGSTKPQNVTFLEEIVEYSPRKTPEDPSHHADDRAETTLNQTSVNNTVLFTTCIQDDTPEKVPVRSTHSSSSIFSTNSLGEVSSVSLQLSVNDTPEHHTANRRWGLDNLSPLGVQHLKRLQSSSDDQDEIPITVEEDSMSESDDEPYVDRRKLMSSSQLKAAESGFSNHLFDDPSSSRRQIWSSNAPATGTSTGVTAEPIVSAVSPSSMISSQSTVTGPVASNAAAPAAGVSTSKEAVAYESIINDYQQRVEKLLAQLQNTMDGQTLPDPAIAFEQSKQERLNASALNSPDKSDRHDTLFRKIDSIRNAQPPPTASKALARTDLDVSMGAEMMAKKMAEIQKERQELSMDDSQQEVGEDRFTDREARLNSLLFSPNSFNEEDPSFVLEIVGSSSDQKKVPTKNQQQHPWMFQGAAQNNNLSFEINSPNQSVGSSAAAGMTDADESINIEYKNFMDQELRAMGQFLNEGINDVIQQKPDVTPTVNTGAGRTGPRTWSNMSMDESMMAMFPTPSPDRNYQTIRLDGFGSNNGSGVQETPSAASVEEPMSSSVLMNELKLELYFAKDELNKSRMNEKSFHDLNKTLEEEKESLSTDLSLLSSKHKSAIQSLTSTKAALDSKNKEYSSLQEKMFELLNTVKKLEQENKVMMSRSPTSAFN